MCENCKKAWKAFKKTVALAEKRYAKYAKAEEKAWRILNKTTISADKKFVKVMENCKDKGRKGNWWMRYLKGEEDG